MQSGGRGRGATFEVRIPAAAAPPERSSSIALVPSPAAALQRRVLIVEDNDDIRESSCQLLGMAGFDVMAVSTGSEALEKAPTFGPHVVLLDVGLPGMSGYDVARCLRQMPAFTDAVLIAVTGYDTPEARALSSSAGFDHHICKPVNFDELTRLLG
jgi:DNA-binding response OmpR family regulator